MKIFLAENGIIFGQKTVCTCGRFLIRSPTGYTPIARMLRQMKYMRLYKHVVGSSTEFQGTLNTEVFSVFYL